MKRTHLFYHDGHYVAGIGSFRAANPEYEDVTRDEMHTLKAILHGQWIGGAPLPDELCVKKTEHGEQVALLAVLAAFKRMVTPDMPPPVVALAYLADVLFAVPNGGSRDNDRHEAAKRGGMLKAEGVKSGVPDLFFEYPMVQPWAQRALFPETTAFNGNVYCGLRIELKRQDGGEGMSESQLMWQEKLRANGYVVEQANGWRAALAVILKYVGLSMP